MLTLDTVYQAAHKLKEVARETDLILTKNIVDNANIYLKTENLQVTGSFKLRGAYYKIATLSEEEKAEIVIETLLASDTIMNVMSDEATKVDNSEDSEMKNYIDNLSESDKLALNSAISEYDATNPKIQTLSKLFGN